MADKLKGFFIRTRREWMETIEDDQDYINLTDDIKRSLKGTFADCWSFYTHDPLQEYMMWSRLLKLKFVIVSEEEMKSPKSLHSLAVYMNLH